MRRKNNGLVSKIKKYWAGLLLTAISLTLIVAVVVNIGPAIEYWNELNTVEVSVQPEYTYAGSHEVILGDTLSQIALDYQVDEEDIIKFNGEKVSDTRNIRVGDVLEIYQKFYPNGKTIRVKG